MRIIAAIFLTLISYSSFAGMDLNAEIIKLMKNGENSFFIHTGGNTVSVLTQRSPVAEKCHIAIKANDAPKPFGNGSATQHAIIECKGFKTIGLRLKPANIDHYHILGFWTINDL